MKKFLGLMFIAMAAFALVGCNDTPVEVENSLPVLAGIQSEVTVQVGDTFDPRSGVTAMDEEDGDITSSITITGLDCLALDTNNVVQASAGGASCLLVYKIEDTAGGKAQKNSTVTVEVVTDSATNLLVNGDFELGSNAWANTDLSLVDLHNGAAGSALVNAGVLEITVTTPSWDGGSAPRVNQEGLDFVKGNTYEVSFDAKASEAAKMMSQVGVLLSASPWFTEYYYNADGDGALKFDLTTAWQTFTYKFTVVEDTTDNGTITFEYGANADATAPITFYLDNVVIKEATPDPDDDAPVFSGLTAVTVGLADGFDPLDGVSFYDVDTTLTNDDIVITHDGGTNVTLETDGTYSFSEIGEYVFTYELT
ncbi:MAG: carbohydrate binding domain-containing protein, partial [Acholeplasmataceae bacterium]|nr:carbohydrate binding domain-containing protein [Acholeplasmataceae bacterium]